MKICSFVLCVYINIPVHQLIFFSHLFQFSIIFIVLRIKILFWVIFTPLESLLRVLQFRIKKKLIKGFKSERDIQVWKCLVASFKHKLQQAITFRTHVQTTNHLRLWTLGPWGIHWCQWCCRNIAGEPPVVRTRNGHYGQQWWKKIYFSP